MKKILITGGCGYIGSALHNFLSFTKDYQVDTVDLEWFGNFSNASNKILDFDKLTKKELSKYDVIIHVAANSSVPLCKNIYDAYDNNVTKFINLVKKLDKQKFIYASSSCVYVTSNNKPKVETDILSPMDGLTFTKTAIDQFLPLTDVEFYGLRFGSVNGTSPNMRLDLMINAMTQSALRDKVVNVFNGHAFRPILGTRDLCNAVLKIIECDSDNRGIYNLASVSHSISEIGQKVAKHLKVPLVDRGNNYTYDFTISSEKFIKTYDFKFEESVESIIDKILHTEFNPKWQKREFK